MELSVTTEDYQTYLTNYYGGSDDSTSSDGTVERLFLVDEIYDGDGVAQELETRIDYFYDGEEYTFVLDTDSSDEEKIYVNLRPTSKIDYIKGIGDNSSITGVEAVKGADKPVIDEYTEAYWSFDEGEGVPHQEYLLQEP